MRLLINIKNYIKSHKFSIDKIICSLWFSLTITLIILKLLNIITCSWWIVLITIWVPVCAILSFTIVIAILIIIINKFTEKNKGDKDYDKKSDLQYFER